MAGDWEGWWILLDCTGKLAMNWIINYLDDEPLTMYMKNTVIKQLIFSLLASIIVCNGYAQTSDSITIRAIPFKLYWENNPVSFKNNHDSLVIESGEKTDMFRDPNVTYNTDNAPKLLFTPDEHFVLIASIHHAFKNKWDGGAIVIIADSLNWIKFCFEKDYTGAHRVVSVVTKDISDDCNSMAVPGNTVFYKVAKAGNVITLYFSANGKRWFLVRHLQLNTNNPIRIGFLSQSPTGKYNKVTFSNIYYSSKKIKDPYLGE
jgi:uncharacterized protein